MNYQDILTRMSENFITLTDRANVLADNSVVTALLGAVALSMSELSTDINLSNRRRYLSTSEGQDLDNLCAEYGVYRRGANAGSAALVFMQDPLYTAAHSSEVPFGGYILIPNGTQVRGNNGAIYRTSADLRLGVRNNGNPYMRGLGDNFMLADQVWAVADKSGSVTNAATASIGSGFYDFTRIDSKIIIPQPITTAYQDLIDAHVRCSNVVPGINGYDAESDRQLRWRAMHIASLLSWDTNRRFEAVLQQYASGMTGFSRSDIFRVKTKHMGAGRIKLTLLLRNGTPVNNNVDITAMVNSITPYVIPVIDINISNLVFNDVNIECKITPTEAYVGNPSGLYASIANSLTNVLDWSKCEFGTGVNVDDLINAVSTSLGVADNDLTGWRTNGTNASGLNRIDVIDTSLYRLKTLTMNIAGSSTPISGDIDSSASPVGLYPVSDLVVPNNA